MALKRKTKIQVIDSLHVKNQLLFNGEDLSDALDELANLDGLTASVTELNYNDGSTVGVVVASKTIVAGANKEVGTLFHGSALPSANALLGGAGASATKETTASANKNFFEYRLENTATSGDNRGFYLRLYLAGTGIGGEALRVFTTVDDVVAGTVHGSHTSLNFNATGQASGLAVAGRHTLHLPNVAAWASGTLAPGSFEIWSDGSDSDPSGVTELSVLQSVLGGHADGIADTDD